MQVRILPGQLIVIVLALVRLHVSVVKFFLSLSHSHLAPSHEGSVVVVGPAQNGCNGWLRR